MAVFGVLLVRIFPAFGLSTDQKNSEYEHFSRNVHFKKELPRSINQLKYITKTRIVFSSEPYQTSMMEIICENNCWVFDR